MTIRRLPTDFLVNELLADEVVAGWRAETDPGRRHAVYELVKTSLTTPEAIAKLARALGVKAGTIDYAGLKDKHARTTQFVSVKLDGRPGAGPPPSLSEINWGAVQRGWMADPLAAAAIAGNRFTITVRDLSAQACQEMDRRAALLRLPRPPGPSLKTEAHEQPIPDEPSLVFVNYFGDQRFGSARAGRGFIAPHLIRGEFEEALRLAIAIPARKDQARIKQTKRLLAASWGDWPGLLAALPRGPERRIVEILAANGSFREAFAALPHFFQTMCVEAYQSHLWNSTARRLAEQIASEQAPAQTAHPAAGMPATGPLRTEDPFGLMVFPPGRAIDGSWMAAELPMFAPETSLADPWREAARQTLAEERLNLDQLRIPGLRRPAFGEARRPLFAAADNFQMTPPETDDLAGSRARLKRTLRFRLPRGAYATVLLRALGQ